MKTFRQRIQNLRLHHFKRNQPLVFIGLIAAVAAMLLAASKAATFSISIEPESGTHQGQVQKISDQSASNGQYITFAKSAANGALRTCYPHAFCDDNNQPIILNGFNLRDIGSTTYMTKGASKEQLQKIKDKGFNAIRLAMQWEVFQPNRGINGFDNTKFSQLKTIVNDAKAVGVYVILDPIHGTNKGDCNGTSGHIPAWAQVVKNGVCQQRIGAINANASDYIKKIAQDYANEPIVAAVDLANEIQPMPYSDDVALLSMYNKLIDDYRSIDEHKILMIEPQGGDKLQTANSIARTITNKSNIIFSSHFYYGGPRDAQGNMLPGCSASGYSGSGTVCGNKTYEKQNGYVYPNKNDLEAHIVANLNMLADPQVRLPLFVGEYNIPQGQPNANQWLQDMTSLFKKHNLSRTLWVFYNRGYPAGYETCADGRPNPLNGSCPEEVMSATDWGDSSGQVPGTWRPWVDYLL